MKRIAFGFLSIWLVLSTSAQTSHLVTTLFPTGPGSLGHYITNSSSGDTIRFDSNLFLNGSDTLYTGSPFVFSHGLVIEGYMNNGDTLYVSGGGTSQIFYADFSTDSNEVLILRTMAVINANYNSGTNSLYTTSGGALMALGHELLILDRMVFRNCKVVGHGRGGAVSAYDCRRMLVLDSEFKYNGVDTVAQSGTAGRRGGAIYFGGQSDSLVIERSSFTRNYAGIQGGAVTLHGYGALIVRNSDFSYNRQVGPNYFASGGAIAMMSLGELKVSNSIFIKNHTDDEGGAISQSGNVHAMEIDNCLFDGNSAGLYGAAIKEFSGNFDESHLTNSTFVNNVCASSTALGAVVLYGTTNVNKCTFINNSIGTGRTLQIDKGIIRNSTILSSQGNGFLVYSEDSVAIVGSIFINTPNSNTINTNKIVYNGGRNIFSNAPVFAAPADLVNINSSALALLPLGNYGGFAPTRPPSLTSPALNAGNPNNYSAAQNGPIYGIRDIGAAEYRYINLDTVISCTPVTWWGNTYSTPGTYTDTAYNANTLDSVGILVLQPLQAQLTNQGGVLTAANQPANATYQWVYCDSNHAAVPNATAASFLPATNGSYALVSTYGNCTDTSACVNYNEVSTQEMGSINDLIIYPNPTKGTLTIQVNNNRTIKKIELLDLNSRCLASLDHPLNSLNFSDVSNGIYLLRLNFECGEVRIEKIIVQN